MLNETTWYPDLPDLEHALVIRHPVTWFACPSHSMPPLAGTGWVQVRDLTWVPWPHVTPQSPQTLQGLQLPSTVWGKEREVIMIGIRNTVSLIARLKTT